MIYRRRWFRNARPVTFIVLPRAYVRIRIAFFPTFSEIEKEYAAGERRLTGAEGRGAKSETIAILGETFRSGALTWLSRRARSGFIRKGKRALLVYAAPRRAATATDNANTSGRRYERKAWM